MYFLFVFLGHAGTQKDLGQPRRQVVFFAGLILVDLESVRAPLVRSNHSYFHDFRLLGDRGVGMSLSLPPVDLYRHSTLRNGGGPSRDPPLFNLSYSSLKRQPLLYGSVSGAVQKDDRPADPGTGGRVDPKIPLVANV